MFTHANEALSDYICTNFYTSPKQKSKNEIKPGSHFLFFDDINSSFNRGDFVLSITP